ncbi:MAG: hypothetical protein Tsb0020_04890 [Haliangiales bacterium]
MRADTELFKDKIEVSLDGRQIFYLFFGGAVIVSLVFVLGVMIGRRVEARTHVGHQPATNAALDPLAALDELARRPVAPRDDELSFPAALAGGAEQPLGKVDRLLASAGPSEATHVAAARPAEAEAAPPRPAPAAHKPARARPVASEPPPGAKFTLQLNSFQDRAEANAFYDQLRESDYKPYVVESELEDTGTWYRVRLGGYDSYDDAIAAKKKFEERMHIIAYVTRLRR